LGSVLKPPMNDLPKRLRDWGNSVRPVIDEMGNRIREWRTERKETPDGESGS